MKSDAPVDLDAAIPVDLSVLAELVGDDPGMMQFAFTEYLETTPADLSDLAEAAAAQDFPGMRDCAHRLKGACNMIGGLKAGALAYELEKRSFAGDLDGHKARLLLMLALMQHGNDRAALAALFERLH